MTLKIGLFVEDEAHKRFIRRLLIRLLEEAPLVLDVDVEDRSSSGGHGEVVSALGRYMKDLHRQGMDYDAVIVGTDANCVGFNVRRKELESEVQKYPGVQVAFAIPDPHIERWFLLDGAAFKKALGVGCRAPDKKCSRDRYKNALRQAVSQSGIFAPFGGIEYAEAIVDEFDINKIARNERSFDHFVRGVRRLIKSWIRPK